MADTATTWTGTGRSDLSIYEVKGQTSGVRGATTAASTTNYTDWSKVARNGALTNIESFTAAQKTVAESATADAQIGGCGGQANTEYENMDGARATDYTVGTVSYYVSVFPRSGATVVDQGAYTIQFQL